MSKKGGKGGKGDAQSVKIEIDSRELREAISKVLKKYGDAQIAPSAPLRIKVKFGSKAEADKVRDLKEPLKVSGTFELQIQSGRSKSLHFQNLFGITKPGPEFDALSKEISAALEERDLAAPKSVAPMLSHYVVLSFTSNEERDAVFKAVTQTPLVIRGKSITFQKNFPTKSKKDNDTKKSSTLKQIKKKEWRKNKKAKKSTSKKEDTPKTEKKTDEPKSVETGTTSSTEKPVKKSKKGKKQKQPQQGESTTPPSEGGSTNENNNKKSTKKKKKLETVSTNGNDNTTTASTSEKPAKNSKKKPKRKQSDISENNTKIEEVTTKKKKSKKLTESD